MSISYSKDRITVTAVAEPTDRTYNPHNVIQLMEFSDVIFGRQQLNSYDTKSKILKDLCAFIEAATKYNYPAWDTIPLIQNGFWGLSLEDFELVNKTLIKCVPYGPKWRIVESCFLTLSIKQLEKLKIAAYKIRDFNKVIDCNWYALLNSHSSAQIIERLDFFKTWTKINYGFLIKNVMDTHIRRWAFEQQGHCRPEDLVNLVRHTPYAPADRSGHAALVAEIITKYKVDLAHKNHHILKLIFLCKSPQPTIMRAVVPLLKTSHVEFILSKLDESRLISALVLGKFENEIFNELHKRPGYSMHEIMNLATPMPPTEESA